MRRNLARGHSCHRGHTLISREQGVRSMRTSAALRSMPREILVYKELDAGLPHMLRLLGG